jgi:hypothetical protein
MSNDLNLRPMLAMQVSKLETEMDVVKWVIDPLNEGNVRDIARAYLMSTLRNRDRRHVRAVEESSRWVDPVREAAGVSQSASHREALIEAGYPKWDVDEYGQPKREFLSTIEGKAWRDKVPSASRLIERAKSEAVSERKHRERQMKSEETQRRLRADMEAAIAQWKQEVIVEWSRELLSATFTIDGQTVTWGEATVAQHEARAESLTKQAVGTVETAAMHMKAVDRLKAAAAQTLNDVEEVAA